MPSIVDPGLLRTLGYSEDEILAEIGRVMGLSESASRNWVYEWDAGRRPYEDVVDETPASGETVVS